VTSRAAAGRYARALFDVARQEADLEQAGRDISGFAAIVSATPALARALSHPAVPSARKRAVVEDLLAHAGAVSPPVAKLLRLLAERDRLLLLPELAEAYQNRLMEHAQIVRAEVTTAAPLPAERLTAIRSALARTTGRAVELETRVDPAIIGGVVTRIGSTVYDGSIARQLERMRETLAGDHQ
jgi:F-type H+-transporting ATPase subunit delta